MTQLALMPRIATGYGNTVTINALIVAAGVSLLALLAQVAIPLPFSPVPLTGQTFGVALVALLWGRDRALATFFSYILVGAAGFKVFALGGAGLGWAPTTGYLFGMLVASTAVGSLADRGWTSSFARAFLAASMGSALIFSFGLLVLRSFVPSDQLLVAGILPFVPGEIMKNILAAGIASKAQRCEGSLL